LFKNGKVSIQNKKRHPKLQKKQRTSLLKENYLRNLGINLISPNHKLE